MNIPTPSRAVVCGRIAVIAIAFGLLAPALAQAAIATTIKWNPSPDPATVGYYVYFGIESHNYTSSIDVGNTTSAGFYLPETVDATLTYFFAVQGYSATGERSQLSAEMVFRPSQAPVLRNPGNITGVVGLSVTAWQPNAKDPQGLPLTYSAGGLPPGISISSNTGRISGTPTTAGNYRVTLAATNSSGVSAIQPFTWMIVGPTSGSPGSDPGAGLGNGSDDGNSTSPIATGEDLTPPTIRITSPAIGQSYRTMNTKIIVTGTASDNVGVVSLMWANSRGGVGTSLGTSSWATTPIDLKMGDNILTITARDAAGNVQTVTFTVTRIVDFENYVN